jgi:hypothetical protein
MMMDEAMEKRKASVKISDRQSKVGPEELSKKRNIGLEMAKVKLLLGSKCAYVLTNGKNMKVVPMASWKEAAESLIHFTDDVGIPETLVMDGATEFTGKHTEFIKQAR